MLTDTRLGYPPAAIYPVADADDFWQRVSLWPLGVPKRCVDLGAERTEMSASQRAVWIGGHRFNFYALALNTAASDCAQSILANRDFETGDHPPSGLPPRTLPSNEQPALAGQHVDHAHPSSGALDVAIDSAHRKMRIWAAALKDLSDARPYAR